MDGCSGIGDWSSMGRVVWGRMSEEWDVESHVLAKKLHGRSLRVGLYKLHREFDLFVDNVNGIRS